MLEKNYSPEKYEIDIYSLWEQKDVFTPKKSDQTHINILPPPNANGSLHLGHASGYAIMDIAGRFARMQGKETLLLPGKDHAGILTQVVFERELLKKGVSKEELGREEFYKQCYQFCTDSAELMRSQEKRMGLSADWSKEKFTLDPDISQLALETFVKMQKKGLAYKGSRIINWCPNCQTALSNMEVDKKDVEGSLWAISYPLEDASGTITVETTRPETMLGDSAVAVHPDDKRYQKFIGKNLILPIVNRKIPVVADTEVDMEFGSGAVKVTPAHDVLDYKIGKRNQLEEIQVIGKDGKMTAEAGSDFQGLSCKEAQIKVLEKLKELGFLSGTKKHQKPLSVHERCEQTVEPLISEQWWINVDHPSFSLKKRAAEAIKNNEIRVVPERFKKEFLSWLENLEDWCVSRQLWWGHQIPAWYKDNEMKVQIESPGEDWFQDPDTFDTWFSSGQWAHNTVFSLEEKRYFPGDLMIMGRDILFFWACRMIMMSLYCTGKVPFKNIYFTGLIRDKNGQKMSKSKGNGINPLEMCEKYGTDALRLSLFIGSSAGNDMRLYEEKIANYRNFVNKLWNASRFVKMQIDDKNYGYKNKNINLANCSKTDKWILDKLDKLVSESTEGLENYRYSDIGQKLYDFCWNDFCDWYLELSKGEDQNLDVLCYVLKTLITLLHPYIPFVTEVIYQELFQAEEEVLALERWPQKISADFEKDAEDTENLIEVISIIRSLRSENKINPSEKIDATLDIPSKVDRTIFEVRKNEIMKLARLENLNLKTAINESSVSSISSKGISINLIMSESNLEKEQSRLKKELIEKEELLKKIAERLNNKSYLEKAPKALIEESKKQMQDTKDLIEKLKEKIEK